MRNLILILAMFATTATFAQTSAQSGAQMTFTSKTVDYGTIAKGSDKFRTVKFKNTGTEPLIITSAQGSCGCTIPTYPQTPIAPGMTDEIKISYDTNRVGAFDKTVTFQTNGGTHVLTVSGKVVENPTVPVKKSGSVLDQ